MTKPREQHEIRAMPRRWAAAAWLGLFLMLFNIVNAAAMSQRAMAAMADGMMPICAEHHAGGADPHHHGPSQPASDCCSCCLSMCCTGAAVPETASLAPMPTRSWVSLAFGSAQSFPLPAAPRVGGSARAPPVIA